MATATSHVRFDDLSSIFAAISGSSRPAVTDLEELCALPTFRAAQLGKRLRGAGLRAVCRGRIPTANSEEVADKVVSL